MDELNTFEANDDLQNDQTDRRSSVLRKIGILLFAFCMFLLFLTLKLPEARIQNYLLAHIQIAAQQQGLSFSAEKLQLTFLTGPGVKLYDVELKALEDGRLSLKIPYLKVRPKLTSPLSATKKAAISAELLDGQISGVVGASQEGFVSDLEIESINVNSKSNASILRRYLPIDLAAQIEGELDVDLSFASPQDSKGKVNLLVHKLALPAQSVMGFNLPALNVSESVINIDIAEGKAAIREFNVGHDLKKDDLVLRVTGDVNLEPSLMRSRLNGKATFDFSQKVKQSFPLIDSLLGPAKTKDGKYAYKLSGTLGMPIPQPGN